MKNTDLGLDKSFCKAGTCPKCKCISLWRSNEQQIVKCINCKYTDKVIG